VIETVIPKPDTASSHGDSVLFAVAFALVVIWFAEQPGWRTAFWSTLILPLLGWGMVANDRRLVWVEVAAALVVYFWASRHSRANRRITRLLIGLSPFILVYCLAGWNSQSGVFAPVQALRSTGVFGQDEQVDGSTLYRDTENYNLMRTMRSAPLFGIGFGQPFHEEIRLPDISFFEEYQYFPHNSILGLWAFTGAIGFTGISCALIAAVYFAGRSYRFARTPEQRIAAMMVFVVIAVHGLQCWGDIGFSERITIYLLGPAIAIAGQLAVATGAWTNRAGASQQRAA
jgi:O-antigen ligase